MEKSFLDAPFPFSSLVECVHACLHVVCVCCLEARVTFGAASTTGGGGISLTSQLA